MRHRQLSLPPLVPGIPLLGNALKLRGDMTRFLVEAAQQHGSIFRIRVLNREYVILAGLEANQFLSKHGNEVLSGERAFGGFAEQMGNGAFLPALEGQPHRHLRRILRPGYSREAVAPHMQQLAEITSGHIAQWVSQPRVQVVPAAQHLITDQLGMVLGGRALGDYFPYVRDFLRTVVNVTILGTAPRLMLRTQHYRTARSKTREFLLKLLDDHRQTPGSGDLIDIALDARDPDGEPYNEDDQILIGIGAYVAGMDTLANTLSFMLYALIKHPHILDAVRREIDAQFVHGIPKVHALRELHALHGAAQETLRMYMIAPVTLRTAVAPFTFDGYSIETGTDVMVANGVTHFAPEYFPDPYTFRHDRDFRALPANVYTPFSLGAHTCLGAGMAEVLLMLSAAVIVQQADITLDRPGFTAHIHSTPAPNPGSSFYLRAAWRSSRAVSGLQNSLEVARL